MAKSKSKSPRLAAQSDQAVLAWWDPSTTTPYALASDLKNGVATPLAALALDDKGVPCLVLAHDPRNRKRGLSRNVPLASVVKLVEAALPLLGEKAETCLCPCPEHKAEEPA